MSAPAVTDGRSPAVVHLRFQAAGPGSEECGSEDQLGPGEIGQFFLHGCANRLPRAAHDPLIYGHANPDAQKILRAQRPDDRLDAVRAPPNCAAYECATCSAENPARPESQSVRAPASPRTPHQLPHREATQIHERLRPSQPTGPIRNRRPRGQRPALPVSDLHSQAGRDSINRQKRTQFTGCRRKGSMA